MKGKYKMFDEDGRKIKIREFPAKMDGMSIAELQSYVSELNDEISRAEDTIQSKQASQAAADSIFK